MPILPKHAWYPFIAIIGKDTCLSAKIVKIKHNKGEKEKKMIQTGGRGIPTYPAHILASCPR